MSDHDSFEGLLEAAERAYWQGELEAAERLCHKALARDESEPDAWLLAGHLALARDDLEAAQRSFERVVQLEPKDADAHYELGLVLAELGDLDGMIARFLEVTRLDRSVDRELSRVTEADRERLAGHAEAALEKLPTELAERLGEVAILIDDYPPIALVEEGFDPRALGLFEGPDDFEQRSTEVAPVPTRIVLFAANLLAEFPEEPATEDQVSITVLHEVGHYFGFDEAQIEALGLA